MKRTFNIPGREEFFKDSTSSYNTEDRSSDYRGENSRREDSKYKISFFGEQVDTIITRRIISNYEFYEYGSKESEEKCGECSSKECSTEAPCAERKTKILLEDKNLSAILKDLLHYNIKKKLPDNSNNDDMLRSVDTRPCEVLTQTNINENLDSIYELPLDSPEESTCKNISAPLGALESFIKSAMDESLAKLKKEINKAIDNKFESFRGVGSFSSNSTNGDPGTSFGNKTTEMQNATCGESPKTKEASQYFSTCKIPIHVRNVSHDRSESINLFETNKINPAKAAGDSDNLISASNAIPEGVSDELPEMSKDMNDTSLIRPSKSKLTQDEMASHHSSVQTEGHDDSGNATGVNESSEAPDTSKDSPSSSDDTPSSSEDPNSRSTCDSCPKKPINPPIVDMTKFMCIIFESFRRINEENMKKKMLEKQMEQSDSSSCDSSSESDIVSSSITAPKETDSTKNPQTSEEIGACVTNKITEETDPAPEASNRTGVMNLPVIAPALNQGDHKEIDNLVRESPVVPNVITVATEEAIEQASPVSPERIETYELHQDDADMGYTVQKFVKTDYIPGPGGSSKLLDDLKDIYMKSLSCPDQKAPLSITHSIDKYQCIIKKKCSLEEDIPGDKLDSKFYCNVIRSKGRVSEVKFVQKGLRSKGSSNVVSIRHKNKRRMFKSASRKTEVSLGSTVISLLDLSVRSKRSWMQKLSSFCTYSSSEEQSGERGNLLKKLCFISFNWGKKGKVTNAMIDQHLSNIYNAICLDFVTDDVYRSVLFISEHLRTGSNKTKEGIMKRWVKICNKPLLVKDKKIFTLDCLHQIWTHFRMKICNLARPTPVMPPNFFPALSFPTEENRYIKEQVIHKYARDILEYISDPRLYKNSLSTL